MLAEESEVIGPVLVTELEGLRLEDDTGNPEPMPMVLRLLPNEVAPDSKASKGIDGMREFELAG